MVIYNADRSARRCENYIRTTYATRSAHIRARLGATIALLLSVPAAFAQTPPSEYKSIPVNYDESKVRHYSLPEALKLESGEAVSDAEAWYKFRRPELLNLFSTYVYGRTPEHKLENISCQAFDIDKQALSGKAVRKQVRCLFTSRADGPKMDILLYVPSNAKKPVPIFLGLNFSGNQSVNADPAIRLGDYWDRETKTRQPAAENTRAYWAREWEVEKVVAHGYGIASIYYGDIDPDFPGGLANGVRPLFFARDQKVPDGDEWGSIGAWAWGLSRALDYLETDSDVDAKRVALVGQSRLGKTVLWAGAQDTRFAMVIANCSGRSGASLARRNFGETVKHMVTAFPHQFAINYQKFGDNVEKLPVDTHELLALIAPRPVLLGTAEEDQWSDPKGEFLAAISAEPVFRLLGVDGLGVAQMPALDHPILHHIGFVYRPGKHEITPVSWDFFLQFADKYLSQPVGISNPEGEN